MPLRIDTTALAALCAACTMTLVACGGDDGPTGPASSAGVTVSFPGGPLFIGSVTQFEARETLSNGTTRVAGSAIWNSDRPQVATVSTLGVVSALIAGETTISADVDGTRGSLLVRVFPSFGGSWTGTEVAVSCVDSGALAGFCALGEFVGETYFHESTLTQNLASVTAVLRVDDGVLVTMTGTITTDGELPLPGAPAVPQDPEVNLRVENWRSRADIPGRMTGTYDVIATIPGLTGSARVGLRLDNVVKASASTAAARRSGSTGSTLRSQIRGRALANGSARGGER
jgi:hypothetical protein